MTNGLTKQTAVVADSWVDPAEVFERLKVFRFRRGLLYLATSKSLFRGWPPFWMVRIYAQRAFPKAKLVYGALAFNSNEDWKARWPKMLASVKAVVFAADADGTVGMGVYQEVLDAVTAGKRVGYHLASGVWVCFTEPLRLVVINPEDRVRHARVEVG